MAGGEAGALATAGVTDLGAYAGARATPPAEAAAREPAPRDVVAREIVVTVEDIRFNALRNAIYHSSRRSFLELVNRSLSFLVVAGGAGAVADLGRLVDVAPAWFAALAATVGLIQLVFELGGKVRTHEFLQRRFWELAAEVAECEAPKRGECIRWDAALNRLYAEEPPPMRALDAIAYNAAVESLGKNPARRLAVRWYHSLFKQLWPFNGTSF